MRAKARTSKRSAVSKAGKTATTSKTRKTATTSKAGKTATTSKSRKTAATSKTRNAAKPTGRRTTSKASPKNRSGSTTKRVTRIQGDPKRTKSKPTGLAIDGLPSGDELLGRCERIVQLALARQADEAEAYWEWDVDLGVEIENGAIANTGGGRSQGGSVRVVVDGRPGFAYLTQESDAEDAIQRAIRNTRAMPALGYALPASRAIGPTRGTWNETLAQLDSQRATDWAKDLLAGAAEGCPKGVVSGGGVGQSAAACALFSSAGAETWDRGTSASVGASVVLEDSGGKSVSASESRESVTAKLDAHLVGLQAGGITQSLRAPKPAKAGRMSLVLEPEVASELIVGLSVASAMGDDAMRGKTLWSKKLGGQVAAPVLSIVDAPGLAFGIPGSRADGEGLATRRLPIIEDGILRNFLFDSWDGHRHKQPSTHSAVRSGFKGRPTAGTHKLVLSGIKPRSADALVSDVQDGYLVDSVLGAHTANATTGEFSVTAPNVWRIQDGAVAGPVKEIAIAGNLPELLANVQAVSKPVKWGAGYVMPRVLVGGMSVSI